MLGDTFCLQSKIEIDFPSLTVVLRWHMHTATLFSDICFCPLWLVGIALLATFFIVGYRVPTESFPVTLAGLKLCA